MAGLSGGCLPKTTEARALNWTVTAQAPKLRQLKQTRPESPLHGVVAAISATPPDPQTARLFKGSKHHHQTDERQIIAEVRRVVLELKFAGGINLPISDALLILRRRVQGQSAQLLTGDYVAVTNDDRHGFAERH